MRTFKKIAGFIIVNLIVVVSLTFMLAQPSVLKILLKEAKNAECDTLIIGESHGETSYDRKSGFQLIKALDAGCES